MIKFVLLVNKQGQTRLAKYFTEFLTTEERRALEGEVVRKCLTRTDKQVGGRAGWGFVYATVVASARLSPWMCSAHTRHHGVP